MSEVIIRNVLWVDIMYAYVHVQTGLDVILRHTAILEHTHCLPSAEDQRLVLRRDPTSLHFGCLLLISVLLILPNECCGVFDRLLRVLVEITREDISL